MKPGSWLAACAATVLFIAATPFQALGQDVLSIRVDGRDELAISNGALTAQHFSWSLPSDLIIDGIPQSLLWNGNTSAPIAVPISGDFWVKKSAGRDGGYAVQRSDGFALAVADNPNGADLYEFTLAAAPASNTTDWMRVLGAGAPPGRMSFAGLPGYTSQAPGTDTTFSIAIDGTDELMFVGGNLVVRHLSWSAPASLTINGVPLPLTFNGNLSDPIPLSLPDRFQFEQLAGRTALYPVQTPVGLVIGADDELLNADVYTFRLVASIASVPEPSPAIIGVLGMTVLVAVRFRCWRNCRR